MTGPEAEKIIDEIASKLGEHFDAVQILVSWPADGGGTGCTKRGAGNWYARQGMAAEFIDENQARMQANELGQALNPPDDSEHWKE